MQRHYSVFDKIVIQFDAGLNTVFASCRAARASPAAQSDKPKLTENERKQSAGLMRVNHSGEVCAQALYRGQLNFVHTKNTQSMLEKAASEETEHLAWCDDRLKDLKSHRSYLNFFWYWNSYWLGTLAAYFGDRWSLGFLSETELQVERHLHSHLDKLPKADSASRAIVQQMKIDEAQHSYAAVEAGAAELPSFIKKLMRATAKLMTGLSYYV